MFDVYDEKEVIAAVVIAARPFWSECFETDLLCMGVDLLLPKRTDIWMPIQGQTQRNYRVDHSSFDPGFWPSFFGFMGIAAALVFSNIGAAYGTARSGIGMAGMGVMTPGKIMKNIIPVIME